MLMFAAAAVFTVGGALPAYDVIVVLRLRHPAGYGPTRVNPSKIFRLLLNRQPAPGCCRQGKVLRPIAALTSEVQGHRRVAAKGRGRCFYTPAAFSASSKRWHNDD